MKGKWKAYNQVFEDRRIYIAERQSDMSKPLHLGNIEYSGEYTEDKSKVNELCEKLNQKEF